MHKVYLLAGGNLNNTSLKYEQLSFLLQRKTGKIIAQSQYYESPPWGFASSHSFVNKAICMETNLNPVSLMKEIQHIEYLLGRRKNKTNHYEDRTMDIDIIFYDNLLMETKDLQIPHPKMHLRNFVLTPMNEICPLFVHPSLKKNITTLKKECPDQAPTTPIAMR
jgi:2-amino-4-hydroxy-6-hydroxymethyldihydropteridine diphosphokinase